MQTNQTTLEPPRAAQCPIEQARPRSTRRTFLRVLLGGGLVTSLGSFFYPVVRYLIPPPAADLGSDTVIAGRVGELQPKTSKIFRFGSRPGLLIRTAEGDYRALSATCTHLGCTVQYKADQNRIWCACHNGVFDLAGRNISGPPPRPLTVFDVHVRGEEIVVDRKREA